MLSSTVNVLTRLDLISFTALSGSNHTNVIAHGVWHQNDLYTAVSP